MPPRMVWTLGLLSVAVAGGAAGAQPVPAAGPALQSAETPAASAPAFDARIDPAQLPSSQTPPPGAQPLESERTFGHAGPERDGSDRGLSFGLELRPQSPLGRLARKDPIEDPSLTEQLQKVIERPALSLRGRYRF
jgi:hypothetical protein